MLRIIQTIALLALVAGCASALQQKPADAELPPQSIEEATAQIRTVATEFYQLLGSRRFADAYARVSSSSKVSRADFERGLAERYPEGSQLIEFKITDVKVEANRGVVSVEARWRRDRLRSVDTFTAPVVREAAGWKIEWTR